ncbi:Biotin carboxyl carrier protein of acetyl-CoA carboxylase 2 [Chlorella vulgaris]
MQAAITERAFAVRPAGRAAVQPRPLPSASTCPKARSVQARAAAEEVKAASTNGAPLKPGTAALDFDELTELIKMVHSTDIVELELNSKKFKLSVKKKEALEASEPQIIHMSAPAGYAAQAPTPAPAAPVAAATTAAPAAPAAPAPAAAAPAAVDGLEVVSPMAGTMYRSPAPGEPVFCKEGDHVNKGDVICIIEAMKLMNTLEAEVSGTVVKVMAENGDSVLPGM